MDHRTREVAISAGLLLALLALGCATFNPRPMEEIPFMERVQTQEREGLRITVAVLDRDEAKRAFGVDVSKKQIQPVWLKIENETEIPYVLMLTGLDPAYFSAREAAYKSHFRLRPVTNGKMDDHFDDYGIDPFVPHVGGRRVPPLGRSTPINADDPHSDTGPCRRRGALLSLLTTKPIPLAARS